MSSNARKVAELLADSKNISDVDNTSTGQLTLPSGTTAQRPVTSFQGAQRFNTTTGAMEFYNGNAWAKVSAAISKLNTVTGVVMVGVETSLTLAGEGFLTSGLIVNFTQTDDSIDTNVTVTPSSDTAASVTVPAAVYNNVTAGRVVAIKVTNSDGTTSDAVNETAFAAPTGGTVTTFGVGGRIHTFTSSGTFVNTVPLTNVEYLVIAGGGGGGVANGGGGGGGAGGYRNSFASEASGRNSSTESKVTSLPAASYSVTVGAGGAGNVHGGGDGSRGDAGSNSVLTLSGGSTVTSIGGGYGGGNADRPGGNGGSGGGAARDNQSEGTGTSGQGFDGGKAGDSNAGGGGGGAGAAGTNGVGQVTGGNGGNGLSSSITGSAVTRAGGGGGGAESPTNDSGGIGGSGGGGKGGQAGGIASVPTAGTANTGSGGGASGDYNTGGNHNGKNGGSGIVIVRYTI